MRALRLKATIIGCSNLYSIHRGIRIKHVTRYTYLLQQTLSWNEHVTHLISKAAKKVGVPGRIRQNITTNTAIMVYKSFILPVLEYCDTVWTCCGKVNASSLEKLQRRATRIIVKSSNSELAMSSLAFDSFADRRDKHVLKFVKKNIEGKAPQYFLIILNQITILARE